MNQQLRDAIKEVAVYDGWEVFEEENCLTTFGKDGLFCTVEVLPYHTSGRALAPVWRKVRDEVRWLRFVNGPLFFIHMDALYQVLNDVVNNNLPEAVIKLAAIIQQIKNK